MDGLVLNLAGPSTEAAVRKVSNKKGGRWTDRVKAKHLQKRNEKRTKPNAAPSSSTTHVPTTPSSKPALKKPRTSTDSVPRPATSTSTAPSSSRPRTQVISSLFSYNPKIEAAHQPDPGPSKPLGRPSNAPLTDSSTFEGLGLDPLITAHIQTKMEISKPTSVQRASLSALLHPTDSEANARDAFIQSQTGSGKTLAFLLPIIQDLLPLSSLSYIDRSIGTLAIIIAPTRELAKQISDVLEQLLTMRLRPRTDDPDADHDSGPRLTRWLVSGLLTGGATRGHEKARLRKGVPILVSTPGRLLDHLQNTESFNVSKCRWLVLDEADRLMELGFEETLVGILKSLDSRRRMAEGAVNDGILGREVGGWDWSRQRRTILCSATIREDVQKLAGMALHQPIVIKATTNEQQDTGVKEKESGSTEEKFTPPSQLSQKYVVVPLKQRLVALVALLRMLLSQPHRGKSGTGMRIIVFMSCTDSVDFHWRLLGDASMEAEEEESSKDVEEDKDKDGSEPVCTKSSLFPDTSIYRLHGSLPLPTRLASLNAFAGKSKSTAQSKPSTNAVLFCTSVASRGLDLPLVRAVVQYDLPTEGGATEYVHRVGRTARAGKGGEAWAMVAPSEVEWAPWVERHMEGTSGDGPKNDADVSAGASKRLVPIGVEDVMRKGFGGRGKEYEDRATEVQLVFERWVLKHDKNASIARKAFQSHMRAYATHPSDEKQMFHVRNLHLGHLAKAFALRDAPGAVSKPKSSKSTKSKPQKQQKRKRGGDSDSDDEGAEAEAETRMREAVRAQGRMSKKGGMLVASGASEFQVTGGDYLEKLLGKK